MSEQHGKESAIPLFSCEHLLGVECELYQVNRALRVLSACHKMLIHSGSQQELLDGICKIAVEQGGYRLAWVGFACQDGSRSIEPVACAGHEEGYLSELHLSWDESFEEGRTPAGQTIRSGVPVICRDVKTDTRVARWRSNAEKRGYRSFVCLPLRDGAKTLGVLALHSGEPDAFGEDEVELLQEMADSLAFGLEYIRTNNQVREQAALLDAAPDALILKGLDQRILFWNKGAERIYGWSAQEVLGRDAFELLNADPESRREPLSLLMEHGEWQGELVSRTKDGRELVMLVRWSLLRDSAGNPKSILALNSDVTEKKRFEAQFLRSQRMESIGTLAGGIAHDLNNVLTPIMMAIDVLGENVRDEEGREILARVKESAQHGSDLVRQVLSFARGVGGQRTEVHARTLVRSVEKMIKDTFPRNISFHVFSTPDLWTLEGDPTQIHQVLTNICLNARDAMPQGGKLNITLQNVVLDEVYSQMNPESQPGSYIKIQIQDSGTGMPPDVRDKVFEPFFTTKEDGKGTGLGLSTSLAIVKGHGGFINVYSEPGKGSCFNIYLPALDNPCNPEGNELADAHVPQGKGEAILVVDDEESIRAVAKRTLERHGYRVLLASNGAEAVATYASKREEIAAVLTDLSMPVMDGSATVMALRTLNPSAKVIVSSGLASTEDVAKSLGLDEGRIIPKPFTAEKLLQVIANVLEARL